jgi:hypothetical protein
MKGKFSVVPENIALRTHLDWQDSARSRLAGHQHHELIRRTADAFRNIRSGFWVMVVLIRLVP